MKMAPQILAICAVTMASMAYAGNQFQDSWDMPEETWEFTTIVGDGDSFTTATTPTSFNITVNEFDAFGFYESDDLADTTPPLQSTNILGVEWTYTSDAENAEDVPEVRFRMTARDGSYTQLYVLQDAYYQDGHESANVPTNGNSYTFQSFADVPQSILNGRPSADSDGYVLAFDVLSFNDSNPNRLGKTVALENVTAVSLTPGDIGTPDDTFDALLPNDQEGWMESDDELGGRTVEHIVNEHGIGIRTDGPGQPSEETYDFSFGWWVKPEAFTLNPNKIYRVKLVVKLEGSDDESGPEDAVPTRLRFSDSNLDFSASVRVGSLQNGDMDNNPTPEGRTYFAWIAFPPELAEAEVPIDIFWEVWQDAQPIPEGSSMFLKELQIKEYDFSPDIFLP